MALPNGFNAKLEGNLMRDLWSPEIADNPYKAIMYAFPWGKPNTPLEKMTGPRRWQKEYLLEMAEYIKEGKLLEELPAFFRKATKSGRGSGKSALIGMIAWWFMSTRIGGSFIVTANTEPQLNTKTMPEISKWFRMAVNSHWFEINAMSIKPRQWFSDLIAKPPSEGGLLKDSQYYYVSAQLWKEEVPDAFAGAHNWNGEFYVYDEGSGIPQPIWQVTEGVFTEQIIDRYWVVFSNPRVNTGPFFECFNKNRSLWRPLTIDCRDVEGVAPSTYQAIIDQYGEDSNEARIEVYGQFPDSAINQFIENSLIHDAMQRKADYDPGAPLIMGVDVARYGTDRSVLAFRQGRDAKSIPWEYFSQLPFDILASKVAFAINKYKPDAVFVDGGGVGGGLVDILKAMKYRVIEVQSGSKADEATRYKNKRMETWARMKEWMKGGALPDRPDLVDDLKGPELRYDINGGPVFLESKESMRERGLNSPDGADALALTFAKPVARSDILIKRHRVANDSAESGSLFRFS